MCLRLLLSLLLTSSMIHGFASAQSKFEPNYDEAKIPDYQLPDPLVTEAGQPVEDAKTWHSIRRPEILQLFANHVYGIGPADCAIRYQEVSSGEAIDDKALRREVDVFFGGRPDAPSMRLLIYTPQAARGPVAAFLALNFQGNHSISNDPAISLNKNWMRNRGDTVKDHRATEAARGVAADRWPIESLIDRGYALVTIYYGDIDPDFDDGFENGIHGHFQKQTDTVPPGSRWGSIAAWAYGLSRALDFLEKDLHVDGRKVAVLGHSRLGKTSLWAGARDPRFAMVISNDSGCGGAALSRRAIGETVGRINNSFPHWFCDNFTEYNENESELPVDQHQLIALIAPRPVYVASATDDQWADPKGEFLSAKHADPVYRLLGTDGMGGQQPPSEIPAPDQPINSGTIGYHLRTGKHDLTPYDWQQYMDFADRHLKAQ